jgi:hypothetical protein
MGNRVPVGFRLPRGFASSRASFTSLLVLMLFGSSGCNRPAQEPEKPKAVESVTSAPAVQARSVLPDCDFPPAAIDAPRVIGHHRVVLKWNPSSSSRGADDQSVGYCLYKSRAGEITATSLHDCRNCSRVNRRPILGTGCVDKYVEDGLKYQYVAGAIKAGSKVELFSNRTTAVVPSNTKSVSSNSPYPLCQPDALSDVQAPRKPDP